MAADAVRGDDAGSDTDDPNYHFSEDMTTRAIAFIREQKAMTPDKPFFAYVSYGAVHAPFHVPKSYIEKYRGKFDAGWDKQREQTFARQKQLGVIPQDARLTARPKIPAWDSFRRRKARGGAVDGGLCGICRSYRCPGRAHCGCAARTWVRWTIPYFSTFSATTGPAPKVA